MEFGDLELPGGEQAENVKKGGVILVVVLAVIILLWLASSAVQPSSMGLSFAESKLEAGKATKLNVEIKNNWGEDASNVRVKVTPESGAIIVASPEHIEPMIGKGAYRQLEFDIVANSTATPGSYRVTVDVTGKDIKESSSVYIEVI